ncbi:Hydroxyacyl-coenzyme A dehydrogenase, mitochondrial [Hondaea fermentalgiana]|uniref:3-hydroxyacyl-CoA dehydrogenase n=1 Tax=Hondaea fermentalgiana TaxID=2315210 RepID=A0A2R5GQG6_9STRA|nr:Hydroxyacyl-coenzyme A dehydrogenase, mitochondrial [Hondaea fermentalgiana]|eukprot:GBG33107.1 Hydroxyacyl-coenzyme A dehydrogenase, mitochondrial [Hondaea fermentalgiana]
MPAWSGSSVRAAAVSLRSTKMAATLSTRGLSSAAKGQLSPGAKIGVVGMGLMGHGIAQLAADKAGFQVVALDKNPQAMEKGVKAIENSLSKVYSKKLKDADSSEVSKKVESIMGQIQGTSDINDLKGCEIVVEAIIENLDIKKSFYKELGQVCDADTVLASNTSSFPIGHLAEASGRPDKVVGLHFFNPVQMMNLCEVVKAKDTSDATFDIGMDFANKVQRFPVKCKDTPGFVVNRLLVPYLAQALTMYDRGEASTKDIDEAMMRGAGHPMGPFHLADYIGHDTIHSIISGWKDMFPDEPAFIMPKCLEELVAEGKLGRKSGQGFYKWEGNKVIKE